MAQDRTLEIVVGYLDHDRPPPAAGTRPVNPVLPG
jgi:hypothetical protein